MKQVLLSLLFSLTAYFATAQQPFITTWKTDNPGTSENDQITIPTFPGEIYDYTVDWGDGTMDAQVTGSITHTYAAPGTYSIQISGTFPHIYFADEGDKEKFLSVDQWGSIEWGSMLDAFKGCRYLEIIATDLPDFSAVQSTQGMFELCSNMQGNPSMSGWDLSNVTVMDFMFREANSFDQDISGWDVSQVTSMKGLFEAAHVFNSPLQNWNVAKVTSMERLFQNAWNFNQPIGSWNVGAVISMVSMFGGAESFNQDIGAWDVSNVQLMILTFSGARVFNQDLSSWDLGSVTNIAYMFSGANNYNGDISGWNTTNIEYMFGAFAGAANFDQNLGGWDISAVKDMQQMFNFSGLSQENYDAILNGWAQLPTVQSSVFLGAEGITFCDSATARQELIETYKWNIMDGGENCSAVVPFITSWKTDNPGTSADNQITIPTYPGLDYNYTVDWGDGTMDTGVTGNITHSYAVPGEYIVSITGFFPGIYFNNNNYPQNTGDKDKLLTINQWGDTIWKSFVNAFSGCANLDVQAMDVPILSNITELNDMFSKCSSLVGNDKFGEWDVNGVLSYYNMFQRASLFNQDISSWDVSGADNFIGMFQEAVGYNQPMNSWDVSNARYFGSMFSGATSFNQPLGNWNMGNAKFLDFMFNDAIAFNQDIGTWDMTSVEIISGMFSGAISFDQNLGTWDVSNVSDMEYMFDRTGLSVENYDSLLQGWSDLSGLQSGLNFDAGNSQFCEAGVARLKLISEFGWSISDDDSNCPGTSPFITTWKTDNPGDSADNQVTIPTFSGETYNYSVAWGDGSSDSGVTGNITHTYSQPGVYVIEITGAFPRIFFDFAADREKLLTVEQWGDIVWNSMEFAFAGCVNLNVNAVDAPDFSTMDTMESMFNGCTALIGNAAMNTWDVSNITNMSAVFEMASQFNQSLANWDVSNVSNMASMFSGALQFNGEIGSWNVANVTTMASMFENATAFDQDLGPWNVSLVSDMSAMFLGATLSQKNYDKLLEGWNSLPDLQNGTSFNAGNSQYCEAVASRQNLISTYGWTIADAGEYCPPSYPFITSWKTDNYGSTGPDQISIPTSPGETYDYTVDWGDGTTDSGVTGTITHTYSTPGIYEVSITGKFPRIYFNNPYDNFIGDDDKLLEVKQWGSIEWTSMGYAFAGCNNLDITATDIPDLSNVTNMDDMFNNCSSLVGNSTIGQWDTGNIQGMGRLFSKAVIFNQPIGNWDTSNVTSMNAMFSQAEIFNQPIGGWDTSKVTNMAVLFGNAKAFNQDLNQWDVSNVQEFNGTFSNAHSFNKPLSNWDVGSATGMSNMFVDARKFNQALDGWNVSNVQNFGGMFGRAIAFNQDISSWDVSAATTLDAMFSDAQAFNQDISQWDVRNAVSMSGMFYNALAFDQDLGDWDVSNVTNMGNMFTNVTLSVENYDSLLKGWRALPSLQNGVSLGAGNSKYCTSAAERQFLKDYYGWIITDAGENCPQAGSFITTWKTDNPGSSEDNQITIPTFPGEIYDYTVNWGDGNTDIGVTGNITHTYDSPGTYQVSITGIFPRIFFNNFAIGAPLPADELKIISIDQWGTQKWTSMAGAFAGCSNLDMPATDIPDFSQLTDLTSMFRFCTSLVANPVIGQWDVSTVSQMGNLFEGAAVFNQDIGLWNVSNVQSMSYLFNGAYLFNQDIGSWDVSNVKLLTATFSATKNFNQNIGNWDVSGVQEMFATFAAATAFNQDLGGWDTGNVHRMDAMFSGASQFNQDIGNWITSNVTTMNGMFFGAMVFDQDLSSWDVRKVTDMEDMFVAGKLSTTNYDMLLHGWGEQELQHNVNFNAGSSSYCNSAIVRQTIEESYGWIITDGGLAPLCNQDNDNDGVADHLDACLETPEGAAVNASGCMLLAVDNFSIEAIGESCPDTNNGQIIIASEVPYEFLATINGTDYEFSNSLNVEELAPGAYNICISLAGQAFEQCYALELAAADNLSGKALSGIGKLDISIEQGTAPYNVMVNGQPAFETFARAFSVSVQAGDYVEVISGKACEGSFSKIVEGVLANAAFPNPTTGIFELALPGPFTEIRIEVFSMHSQLMSSATYPVAGGKVLLDISKLPDGVYLIKPRLQNPQTFKIVKQ